MSFKLPTPKTRKEYFMAIAAGGVPGEDFPARYEVAPVAEYCDYTYEETLSATTSDSGYKYKKSILEFNSIPESATNVVVTINNKVATKSGEKYVNEDGYTLARRTGILPGYDVYIVSETELSGDALNVTVETSWDALSKGTPLQPKTVEEAYYTNLAEIDVATALASMSIKTRKDQYLNAIIKPDDNSSNDQQASMAH